MTEFFAHSVKLRLSGCDDLIPWVEVLPSSTGRDHMEANPAWAAPTSFSGTTGPATTSSGFYFIAAGGRPDAEQPFVATWKRWRRSGGSRT